VVSLVGGAEKAVMRTSQIRGGEPVHLDRNGRAKTAD